MYSKRLFAIGSVAMVVALAGCDKDPNQPRADFSFTGCPTGPLAVNSPIALNFSGAVSSSAVTSGNVVVTDASTGIEVPGSLSLGSNGTQVLFTPSSPLPFGTVLGIRVQNLTNAAGSAALGVSLCNVLTQAAPITELFWTQLQSPTGTRLIGASLFAPDSGWVASEAVPLYRRVGNGWDVRFTQPYYALTEDLSFVSATHGWSLNFNDRQGRSVITRTRDGFNFDTVFSVGGRLLTRIVMDSAGTGGRLFGIVGGGTAASARFTKYNSTTGTFSDVTGFSVTSDVSDIDYPPGDTLRLVATTRGSRFVTGRVFPGRVYQSADGGSTWTEIAGAQADTIRTITYQGVARRTNGDVWVVGGNGFVGKLANGATPYTRVNLGVASLDTTDYNALIYTDVQFAPDNNNIGWIVGRQLIGYERGIPQYRGLIFGTTNGGQNWTRQGVRGADEYGASFPALNRLDVFSSTSAWAVGEGGTVLSLKP